MYGSVFRMKPKAGVTAQQVEDVMMTIDRTPKGMKGAMILREDGSGHLWGIALFEDEKTYRANAADPAQDAEYRKFRALLEADPEWHDGAISELRL